MPSARGQPPSPSRKVCSNPPLTLFHLKNVLGPYYLYPFTFLWARSQQPPPLAFSSNTRHEASLPKPSSSMISLGRISFWTPTHSTFHPWHWNHCIGQCQWRWRTLSGLLPESFPPSSQQSCCWILERGNSCYAMCKKWCGSSQYATKWCS